MNVFPIQITGPDTDSIHIIKDSADTDTERRNGVTLR